MEKLFVLGMVLFFCLFFTGCSWVIVPLFIPDNGGMYENTGENTGPGFTNSHFMFLL